MLWAEDDSSLPNNYFSALVQLKSLERRLGKDVELKERYSKTIHEDHSKSYKANVDKADCFKVSNAHEWYLPHHPVVNRQKPGKVRRVLNGAAKFKGHSLNRTLDWTRLVADSLPHFDSIPTIPVRRVCRYYRNVPTSWSNSGEQAVTSFPVARSSSIRCCCVPVCPSDLWI